MFIDESKFGLSSNGEGVRVWRRVNTRKDLVFLRNGGLTARRYIDEILERQVIPRANVVDQNFVSMQGR
jgi:hypothetical protein